MRHSLLRGVAEARPSLAAHSLLRKGGSAGLAVVRYPAAPARHGQAPDPFRTRQAFLARATREKPDWKPFGHTPPEICCGAPVRGGGVTPHPAGAGRVCTRKRVQAGSPPAAAAVTTTAPRARGRDGA